MRGDDLPWLARTALLPVRRFGDEHFEADVAKALVAGAALHADLTPESAGSALFGWLLCGLAQQVGFPAPVGGAGALTDALVRRLRARGGVVRAEPIAVAPRNGNGSSGSGHRILENAYQAQEQAVRRATSYAASSSDAKGA